VSYGKSIMETEKGKAMKGRGRVYQTDEEWARMMRKEPIECKYCKDTGKVKGVKCPYGCKRK